ncbi:glycine oxidase ThiO [Bailinhaonella thermotolerans]|uniref:glycine oxidase n=1 Tax=Bailinhaonella thermotolerans TaxID=1070861 RepID=A0A3A4AS04_9ACTN|nr:glycine oxidase ThiO [Bailinhaonella thermotolerans]RJL31379.1 glycine oxidase ThiO [Bailinhaonella thermotolerans]
MTHDVIVVGGGIIGLSVAWRAAAAGLSVAVMDAHTGGGASHAAAGMLAPVSEVTYTEEPLLRIGLASLDLWGEFAAELDDPATPLDFGTSGTLEVAASADDLAVLDDLARFQDKLGLPVERLTGRECRRLEPMLAPGITGGLLCARDAWVDPRRVVTALRVRLRRLGVPLIEERAERVEDIDAGAVVLAAGSWSGGLAALPVRPVKGQILRLRGPKGFLGRTVRGLVRGSHAYLVPRGDGELVLGATQEEMGFDTTVTAGGVWELLRDAREVVPGITELELAETYAGLRPGTPDNLPLIGPVPGTRVIAATGHGRNGVLLAPFTAETVVRTLTGGEPGELAAACDPGRFAP